MDPQSFFAVVKELGFPIAVGGILLLYIIHKMWVDNKRSNKQFDDQQAELKEQRESDRALTREVVNHIAASNLNQKTIIEFMDRSERNMEALNRLFEDTFQSLGDARQSLGRAEAKERVDKKKPQAILTMNEDLKHA